MTAISPWPSVLAAIVALATCAMITRLRGVPAELGRFASIDGLRGYLALMVFLSHGCLWYFYARTGRWETPPSRLYTFMGEGSVAVFFMITAFLFSSKLLDSHAPIDWPRLFLSRLLRLGPLYLVAAVCVFALATLLSGGILRESLSMLCKQLMEWLAFSVIGSPNINRIENSYVIVAGVTWSLSYEWYFYLSLPMLALCMRRRPAPRYVLLAVCVMLAFPSLRPNVYHLASFGGGIIAAYLTKQPRWLKFSGTHAASCLAAASVIAAAVWFPTADDWLPLLLLSLAFALISCGNALFGILHRPVSYTLGQLAYGIYLLHGILLFVAFRLIIGIGARANLAPCNTGHGCWRSHRCCC